MQPYLMDLHIHTALSPCAEKEMTPSKIVHAAKAKGLKIIAVTDHNTAENAVAVMQAAIGSGIFVIPGMELQTREEVHLLCLFPSLDTCLSWQQEVYQKIPAQPNRPEVFGFQPIMDSSGRVIQELDRMLLASTEMSVETAIACVGRLGGICVPAHIDRPSYSIISNLGFVPPGLPLKPLELSRHMLADEASLIMPSLKGYNYISSSDAHCLRDIGSNPSTIFIEGDLSFTALKTALWASDRKVVAQMKDLAMHIIDILQNSVEANAQRIELSITEDLKKDLLTIKISDNGRGMDKEVLNKVVDPFFTTRKTRRVGLGLPLFKAAAERCDGEFLIESWPGQGTSVQASFRHSHIDRAPVGDMVSSVVNFIVGNPDIDLVFSHQVGEKSVVFNAAELRNQLEDVPLDNPAVVNWINNYLREGYADLRQV